MKGFSLDADRVDQKIENDLSANTVRASKLRMERRQIVSDEFDLNQLRVRFNSLTAGDFRNQCFSAIAQRTSGKLMTA
jgi:hypothetical protein